MENTMYEIAKWLGENPVYLVAPAAVAAGTAIYLAISFDPKKKRENRDAETGLVNKLK